MNDKKQLLDTVIVECSATANHHTLREYFKELLATLWQEKEGFSGKRPFGDSLWEYDVYKALVVAEAIPGLLSENGELDECDERLANTLIANLIDEL